MSLPDSPTLTIDVRARRSEGRIAGLALGCAALVPPLLPALHFLQAGCASLLAAAVILGTLRRAGWMGSAPRIVSICWSADGRWLLHDQRGEVLEGELAADSRVGRWGAWLRWKIPGRSAMQRSMLLMKGDLGDRDLRRLLLRLRVEYLAGVRGAGDIGPA